MLFPLFFFPKATGSRHFASGLSYISGSRALAATARAFCKSGVMGITSFLWALYG